MKETDRDLFDDVAKEKFGMEVRFGDVERDLAHLRLGGAITYSDLKKIADASRWPFDRYWMWPAREQVEARLPGTDGLLVGLRERLGDEGEVIGELLDIFRSADLASILLRFVWPEEYGIYSRPPLYVLGTKRGRNASAELRNYFDDLRLFRDTLQMERAADFEMVTWAVSYQKDRFVRNFKRRLAERLPHRFPIDDIINFNRRDPMKLAVLLQRSGHFVTACKWLGEAVEGLMKEKCVEFRLCPDEYETLGEMIYSLEASIPEHPWYARNRDSLKQLTRLRNEATHNSKFFMREQADRMFSIVRDVFHVPDSVLDMA